MSDVKVPVFEIDGREYEWPGLMSLNVRECRIFREETGIVWETLWIEDMTVADLFKREGFLSAMARIAYVREHPEALDDAVKAVIERQPAVSLFATALAAITPDEPSAEGKAPGAEPTSSSPTKNEPESNENGESSKPETSGSGSTTSSDQPDDPPEATGTGGSDPSSMSLPLRRVI